MNSFLKKEAAIYGAGHILTRLATFLLLPLFTNIFTRAEYGVISLIYIVIGFFTVVLHLGLDASLLKYYKNSDLTERKQYVTNTYLPLLMINIGFF